MDNFRKMFADEFFRRLSELQFKCKGCPQVRVCENDRDNKESRYCTPIIVAALLNEDSFESEFQKEKNKNEVYNPGDRVKVFDALLFKDDVTTPLSMTMQPATVVRGNYSRADGEEMIDVQFDRDLNGLGYLTNRISHGHFIWGVEKI